MIVTRVLIRSREKHHYSSPRPLPPVCRCYMWNLVKIGFMASEEMSFENADRRMPTDNDNGCLPTLSAQLWAFGNRQSVGICCNGSTYPDKQVSAFSLDPDDSHQHSPTLLLSICIFWAHYILSVKIALFKQRTITASFLVSKFFVF